MSTPLKPWFAVATPHEDVREGRLSEAVFAANLWAVVQNNAPQVYLDPVAFFSKTYLTTGLTNVLKKVVRALEGSADAGDRILSLQTAFGGGKTHILIALWHLAKHADQLRNAAVGTELQTILGELPHSVNSVAIFTHETCDATQGRQTPEGIHTRTLWGELALQLGGLGLYRKIEANDQARTVPQGLFADILRAAAPCLILLDELADYCIGASSVEVGNATLADQTISFVQQLTQAAEQVKGVAIVATLPASELEVASADLGSEILNRLERRFGRMGADITPVADAEVYEVVRRRLFESVGDPAEHEAVADAYMQMYQAHQNEVPSESTRMAYKERMIAAYPFYPTLIDALSLRWGSHSDFQRTRGVLRLLASIVGDLWRRRHTETQSQPLIMPCHLRWTIDTLHATLTRLWGAAYQSVVAADVIGEKANASLLDEERGGDYANQQMTGGLAGSILLGSFGGGGERAGYSTKDLRLCVGRPDVNWGYTDGALLAYEDRAFYLHTASAGNLGKRYWFGTTPTLTKLVVQYRGQLETQDFAAEIIDTVTEQVSAIPTGRLKEDGGTPSWRVLVNPQADLPEQRSLTLLVMPPESAYTDAGDFETAEQRLLTLSQNCSSRERHYRNTLLFLLPSPRGLGRLRSAMRDVAALRAVQRDYASQLDSEQLKDLHERLEAALTDLSRALGSAYTHLARIEKQRVAVSTLTDAQTTFDAHLKLVWEHVIEEEWVLRKVGRVTLGEAGLIPIEGGIRVKDAIEAFLRYTDKPMVTSPNAVIEGLKEACEEKQIGIGRGVNPNALGRKWCGAVVALDPTEEGVWIIPPFEPHPPAPSPSTERGSGGEVVIDGGGGTSPQPIHPLPPTPPVAPPQQVQRVTIRGAVSLENWSELFRCFVGPAARMNLKRLRLGIDFEMEAQDGQPFDENDPAIKAMKEAARQLGLKVEEG